MKANKQRIYKMVNWDKPAPKAVIEVVRTLPLLGIFGLVATLGYGGYRVATFEHPQTGSCPSWDRSDQDEAPTANEEEITEPPAPAPDNN